MTEIDTARVHAAFAELRSQRDMFADRCANMAQEIAELKLRLNSALQEPDEVKSRAKPE